MRRRISAVITAALLLVPFQAQADLPDLDTSDISRRIETARETRPVAPGVTLNSFDWYEPGGSGGWMRGDALTVDLSAGAKVGYLSPGAVSRAEPLSTQATRVRAVAAVNGDFFDINNSNAPAGVAIKDGRLVKSAQNNHHRAVGIDAAGVGRVMEVFFTGTLATPGGDVPLTQLNSANIGVNGIGVFNPLWGDYQRSRAVEGAARVTEVIAKNDVVTSVGPVSADPIPADGYTLVGRESGADALTRLRPGDRISLKYAPRTSDGSTPVTAVGGNHVLVRDGVNVAPADPLHPRTAVGFSQDGRKMFVLTVDGRQAPYLLGMNLRDLAEAMRELGAHNALNLDGGGSSTMLARSPGATELHVANTPSDGAERPVPNGLAIYAPEGSGRLTGFAVTTEDRRVFPDLTRRLEVRGHDETFGPVEDDTHRWENATGRVEGDLFRASVLGDVRLTAYRDEVRGSVDLTVIGPLQRLQPSTTRLNLGNPGDRKPLRVNGFDARGFTALIEPGDLELTYDRSVVEVTDELEVIAKAPGATTITARVQGKTTHVGVTVGANKKLVAGFDDGAQWKFGSARATGSVTPVPDGRTGAGLKLSYDFTQSTGTRTAYAIPPQPIRVDGQPLSLGAWVYGHGRGEWTAFTVTDARGQTRSLYGPYITWHGWRELQVAVPPELAFPLQVNRFYTIETKADRQYTGEVLVDDITAKVPPSVTLPPTPTEPDPVVVRDGTVDGKAWRFAVMSDAQFVARAPDSELVRSARRTMREIRAARPDFVVINGDLVDEASPADLAFAHRILHEELDGVPWYYVPGNHEIMGPGTIDNFRREFGVTNRTFDHKGTRFVLLDSSTGTIRGGGFDQMVMLRDALSTQGPVVVMAHHPPRDPTPAKGSQLSDRMEATYVEQLLSGRRAMYIGAHVGLFHASTVDGVPYLINGNSGKAPAETGGFTGWTLVGVDPSGFAAEIRPHVDSLSLNAPGVLRIGTPGQVDATITQGTRRLPVAYPMSSDWSGSPGLHIGPESGVKPWHVAWLDPLSGKLTAVRTGEVRLALTVNGVTRHADIRVTLPEYGLPAA